MTKADILSCLTQRDCGITTDEIFSGKLDQLIDRGLRVLTLCFDGSGRSRTVADQLTYNFEIPAVRLIRGIKQIENDPSLADSIPALQSMINACPVIAVILTPEEIRQHYAFISNLRALKYPNSSSATRSLEIMEG